MKVSITLSFSDPGYIGKPYWAEKNTLINIVKDVHPLAELGCEKEPTPVEPSAHHMTELEQWRRIYDLAGNDPDEVKRIANQEIKKREAESLDLWEILVPVASNEGVPFLEDHHKSFRRILRGLPGNNGTTTRPAGDGDWEDKQTGGVYAEKMIPIRFKACRADAERMAAHARKFYDQIEVWAYRLAPGKDIIIARAES